MPGEETEGLYNRAFELLVDEAEDKTIGFVAYAIYKRQKREWIVSHQRDHGRRPTNEEVRVYNYQASLPGSLEGFRNRAKEVLAVYAQEVIAEAYAGLRDRALEDALFARASQVLAEVTKKGDAVLVEVGRQGGFWRGLGLSILSSVVTTAVIIVLAVSASLFGVDLIDGISKLRGGASPASVAPSSER